MNFVGAMIGWIMMFACARRMDREHFSWDEFTMFLIAMFCSMSFIAFQIVDYAVSRG